MTRLLAVLVISFGLVGCASTTAQLPGSLNAFDSQAFTTLTSAQAAITQAKVDIAKYPQFKATLNKIIAGYNTTEDAYQAYHAAVASGKTIDPAMLSMQIAQLLTDIGSLQKSIAGVSP